MSDKDANDTASAANSFMQGLVPDNLSTFSKHRKRGASGNKACNK